MLHAVKLSAIRIAVFAIQPRASLLPLLPFRSLQCVPYAQSVGRETRWEGVWLSTADDERLSPGS